MHMIGADAFNRGKRTLDALFDWDFDNQLDSDRRGRTKKKRAAREVCSDVRRAFDELTDWEIEMRNAETEEQKMETLVATFVKDLDELERRTGSTVGGKPKHECRTCDQGRCPCKAPSQNAVYRCVDCHVARCLNCACLCGLCSDEGEFDPCPIMCDITCHVCGAYVCETCVSAPACDASVRACGGCLKTFDCGGECCSSISRLR